MIAHHFSVDVEEYFHVSAFEGFVQRSGWSDLESRVVASVSSLLRLLEEGGARATFFVLGWVAQRHPQLVRDIAGAGHEVASHGWDHRRVPCGTREDFRASVRRSKALLEDLAGQSVIGYRAPSFSIIRGYEWALDVLVEEGYTYDSSLFPVWRPGYGYANGRRDPHWLDRPAGRLLEVPPATLRRWGVNIPAAGGAYFRLLPYALVRAALSSYERREVPATFYIHPWELDAEQPRLPVPLLTRLRHYTGLERTATQLERLLGDFSFRPIVDTVDTMAEPEVV